MDAHDPAIPPRPPWQRHLYFAGGIFACLLGVIGAILPLMPGIAFFILAAWCFSRSSPRFERWLVNHPQLGPPIRHWRLEGAIDPKAKYFGSAGLAVTLAGAWFIGTPPLGLVILALALAGVAGFLLTRPSPSL